MKTKPNDQLKFCWQVLTEIPGWADAPLSARFRRSLPIVLPLMAIVSVLSWHFAYHAPQARAHTLQMEPLLTLEKEITSLQMATSQQQLAELNERIETASALLITPTDLPELLQQLKTSIRKLGWDVTFQIAELPEETPGTEPLQITYLPVRAKFKPQANNENRFASLLAALEHLSSNKKRIDLTRVAIRADESRWQTVEVNLRLISPSLDAKTL